MPLIPGYSRATVSKNIENEVDAGRPQFQAVAMALRSARASFKKRHPGRALPEHLKPKSQKKKHHRRANPKKSAKKKHRRTVKRSTAKRSAAGHVHHNYYVKKGAKYFDGAHWVSEKKNAAVWHNKDAAIGIARKLANLGGHKVGVYTETKKH